MLFLLQIDLLDHINDVLNNYVIIHLIMLLVFVHLVVMLLFYILLINHFLMIHHLKMIFSAECLSLPKFVEFLVSLALLFQKCREEICT